MQFTAECEVLLPLCWERRAGIYLLRWLLDFSVGGFLSRMFGEAFPERPRGREKPLAPLPKY